ncbi:Proteasome inhibitor PI31 subunit [Pseudolycoriella hygida]|uniref:Proteasome inhibitor PI31 subunit n=1 Tax=Pseudolycoriella hygida TaxID=35572 RepID=A0A9Q0MLV8_9DIPT|nr:Proteasome inhibitor PI31 subunit [Pseudolycoriella hygida]
MDDPKIIEEWIKFYNRVCVHIRTKNGLLSLVAHFCLIRIIDMGYIGNVCISGSDDERESLPRYWNYNGARLALRYESKNHVYTLLGKVTNACFLLNFKSRQIKALSNNITLNVDDMTDVIDGKICLRKPVQEVTKLLVDELFTPVVHLSQEIFDLYTNARLDIPPSLENADLQSLHRNYYFLGSTESERHLGQLRRALDGNGEMSFNPEQFEGATKTSGTLTAAIESPENSGRGSTSASSLSVSSGLISHTPGGGGYSGMHLNPHSSSNSHYFGGTEDQTRRFLTPGGYDGMLVSPNHLTNSQYFRGFNGSLGNWTTPGGYDGMLVSPNHLTNSQYFGGFNGSLGNWTTPGGYNGMLVNPTGLANSQYFGGSNGSLGNWTTPGGYNGMLVNPTGLANSQYFGGSNGSLGNWTTPGGYNGMLVNPTGLANSQYFGGSNGSLGNWTTPGGYNGMLVNPTNLANSQYSGGFERIPGSSPTPTLGWGETISYRPFLTNPNPLGGEAETVGRFTNEIDLAEAKRQP